MSELERRTWQTNGLEVRGSGRPRIVGHAAVFDTLSLDLGGFREKILPGAFADSLHGDVRALWDHNSSYPLGRTRAGTLKLREDSMGLRVEIFPPDTQWARDALESMRRGDVTGMSFAFHVPPGGDAWGTQNGETIRTLKKVILAEVSPVVFPAYEAASAEVRAVARELRQAARAGEPWRAKLAVMRRRLDAAERWRSSVR